MTAAAADSTLRTGHIKLVLTAFLAMAASALAGATFEFMIVPLQIALDLSADQTNAATLVPTGASLLVVFIVGALGDRVGLRRVMIGGAASFVLGAALVAVAWGFPAVIVGRGLGGIGALTMSVIGLAVVNSAFHDDVQRARVFAAYAALVPAVFIVSPQIGAWLTSNIGWRVVPVLWVLLGCAVVVMAWGAIPAATAPHEAHREMLTPVLAGMALAGIASTATLWSTSTTLAGFSALVGLSALLVLVVVMRRTSDPSLDIRVLRAPGAKVVFLAVLLATMPNLFFYTNLLIQYRYTLPLSEIALMLVAPQAAAVAGGLASAPLVRRFGAPITAIGMLLAAAVTSLATLLVGPQAPVWVPVAVLTLCAAPIAGAVGPLTKTIMDMAPADGSSAASAWRNATWSLGGTVGGVIVAGLAFAVFQSSLTDALDTTDISTEQAAALAASVRSGAVVTELADSPLVTDPVARELLTGEGLQSAQSQAFATAGLISAGLYASAALVMFVAVRRRSRATAT